MQNYSKQSDLRDKSLLKRCYYTIFQSSTLKFLKIYQLSKTIFHIQARVDIGEEVLHMSSIGMSTISSKEGVGHRYSEMMFAKTQLGIYLCCRNLYRRTADAVKCPTSRR